jgi:hypothetical protein
MTPHPIDYEMIKPNSLQPNRVVEISAVDTHAILEPSLQKKTPIYAYPRTEHFTDAADYLITLLFV